MFRNVEVVSYRLDKALNTSKTFDPRNWRNLGKATVKIYSSNGRITSDPKIDKLDSVCKIIEQDNENKVISFHLIHPESCFKTTRGNLGRMFWVQEYKDAFNLSLITSKAVSSDIKKINMVETCYELIFNTENEAIEFEETYSDAQDLMSILHEDTEDVWKTTIEACDVKSEDEEEEFELKSRGGSQTTQAEDDDSSEVSEISLDLTDEDEVKNEKVGQQFKFPSLQDARNMWKCPVCTTGNPNSQQVCLSCKALDKITYKPGSEPTISEQNESTQPSLSSMFGAAPKQENTQKSSFSLNFSKQPETSNKPSFSFGATSASAGPSAKSSESTFQFGLKTEEIKSETQIPKKQTTKSPYPPMETMKKVEQVKFGEPKAKSSPYPPMASMQKVEQMKFGETKPKSSSPYPPMETMKKVEQVSFGAKKTEETKDVSNLFGGFSLNQPSSTTKESQPSSVKKNIFGFTPPAATTNNNSNLFSTQNNSTTFGGSGFGSTSFGGSGFGGSSFSAKEETNVNLSTPVKEETKSMFQSGGFSNFATNSNNQKSAFGNIGSSNENVFK